MNHFHFKDFCFLFIFVLLLSGRRRNNSKKDPESPVPVLQPSAPPYECTGVYAIASAIDENDNIATGKIADSKTKPGYDNVVVVDNGVRYSTWKKVSKNTDVAVNEDLTDDTIMQENDELYAGDDVKENPSEMKEKATEVKELDDVNDEGHNLQEQRAQPKKQENNHVYVSKENGSESSGENGDNDDNEPGIMYEYPTYENIVKN